MTPFCLDRYKQLETYYLPIPKVLSLQTICVAAVLYYYVNKVNKSCIWILFCKSKEKTLNNKTLTVQLAWISIQYFNTNYRLFF